ncbi:helix-turn-helix domain-containing protein [Streptosporangium sp. NBC_01810]|uniref:helix-turn-helix domain-containing protein n=1 Tax=Streptosporangium sp. NBC_01810 TaxID=2975951 RepID=UPI002DD9BF4F|nr:helix-turn-helix domain-containing protein [Streptosporangium sp. NBC_01810]WSA25100.1 helix-turn-helix domain-containing protein [Streptosporangium sp. NBC_01810]
MEPLFYRPKDAAVMLGMSRTAVFRLIKSGELKSIKDEGYRLVPRWALHEFARALETKAGLSQDEAA